MSFHKDEEELHEKMEGISFSNPQTNLLHPNPPDVANFPKIEPSHIQPIIQSDKSYLNEDKMDFQQSYEEFRKIMCSICGDTLFLQDIFICNACSSGICFNCTENEGRWIHIRDDCDLCYEIYTKNVKLQHTLYFVCGNDCERVFVASYF